MFKCTLWFYLILLHSLVLGGSQCSQPEIRFSFAMFLRLLIDEDRYIDDYDDVDVDVDVVDALDGEVE